jgi:hypothetical protein
MKEKEVIKIIYSLSSLVCVRARLILVTCFLSSLEFSCSATVCVPFRFESRDYRNLFATSEALRIVTIDGHSYWYQL